MSELSESESKNGSIKVSLFLCSYRFINHLNLKKKCKRPEYNDEDISFDIDSVYITLLWLRALKHFKYPSNGRITRLRPQQQQNDSRVTILILTLVQLTPKSRFCFLFLEPFPERQLYGDSSHRQPPVTNTKPSSLREFSWPLCHVPPFVSTSSDYVRFNFFVIEQSTK